MARPTTTSRRTAIATAAGATLLVAAAATAIALNLRLMGADQPGDGPGNFEPIAAEAAPSTPTAPAAVSPGAVPTDSTAVVDSPANAPVTPTDDVVVEWRHDEDHHHDRDHDDDHERSGHDDDD